MNFYLIDYENVNSKWLEVDILPEDRVIIFFSENQKMISLEHLAKLRELNVTAIPVHTGKNALDFQLSSYLGFLIGTHLKTSTFHIISNDKGYDPVCAYWRQHQIFVDRIGVTMELGKVTKEELSSVLTKHVDEVYEICNRASSRTQINNELIQKFQDQGVTYKKIKKLLEAHKYF